ncbi:MAG: hypothetical protein EOO00_09690 [Chitinophagaceae bacterium]|nr:MAG: hypothetical protein EOO00_09690 [Chitinophagaceae bacterium]
MSTVLTIHSILRWLVLLFGILAVLGAIGGLSGRKPYTMRDNKMNLFFMICCDIQLLIGIILIVANGWWDKLKGGMGEVMKDSYNRFFTIEHALIMIIAWILVHVGRSAVKKATLDSAKHRKVLIFSGIALLLILISIPWPFRELVGRPWFR